MGLEGREHFLGVELRNLVDAGKLVCQRLLGLIAQGADTVTDL